MRPSPPEARVPSRDIPQANRVDLVRRVVELVAGGKTSTRDLEAGTGLSTRHVAYYAQAAQALGWLERGERPTATEHGLRLLATAAGGAAEAEIIAASIDSSEPLRRTVGTFLREPGAGVDELARRLVATTWLSPATARRRASCLSAWRTQLMARGWRPGPAPAPKPTPKPQVAAVHSRQSPVLLNARSAMDYFALRALYRSHPAWHLLRADHAPLILAFLHRAFIQKGRRAVTQAELVIELDDYLRDIRAAEGPGAFPRSGRDYLEEWARGDLAHLRKYYPKGSDQAELDLTPATEKALQWLSTLEQKQFVGTESRLQSLLRLLYELVQLTETDAEKRVLELERQKRELQNEIDRLTNGGALSFDATRVKERFFEIEDTARQLLSDFRQVEENFRGLDRNVRETIATSDAKKGALLDTVFGDRDVIQESDQGKSFRAFWQYLMSPQHQANLKEWIERVYSVDVIAALPPSDFLRGLRPSLLDAGEKVQRTSALLVEQLRRYLDEQVWLENRRIMQIIGSIERHAVQLKDSPPTEKGFVFIDDTAPDIDLPMARGILVPQPPVELEGEPVSAGTADFTADALYEQQYVDVRRLRDNIRRGLRHRSQISLGDLLAEFPLEQGLAELVAYFNLAAGEGTASIDDAATESVLWRHADGAWRRAKVPRVVFTA